jgi:glycosyltransferase involved in cell wall biosynthesis
MRILFLTHYFPPEVNAPASRTFEHCREWVQRGCEVTVITCAPNHPQGKLYPGYRNRFYQTEYLQGIRVIRLWTWLAANEGFVMRTLNYASYLVSAVLAAPFLPKTDVVLSTSPQFFCGLAGYFVGCIKRKPWILEIRDLWPDSILAVGAVHNRPLIGMLRSLERFVYRKADHIVAVTAAFKRHIMATGIAEEKIDVIKNGVDLDFYVPSKPDPDFKQQLGLQDGFVISYVGTHGMAHHLETVLEAARQLSAYPQIRFLLVGDGAERKRLLAMRDAMQLQNVVMLDQQPKQMMPKIWSISDVSLVHLKRSELFSTVIPSKLFESMAMQKPVLLGVDGESRQILEEAQAGLYIEPENSAALAAAVLNLFNDRALYRELALNGRQYAERFCGRSVLAQRYLKLMQHCVNGISAVVAEKS